MNLRFALLLFSSPRREQSCFAELHVGNCWSIILLHVGNGVALIAWECSLFEWFCV
ncbi:hypothetical protein Sjap_010383 [Stephania japonica]|uniref:Uncharacterized protein n=1 Tax=Stephania japonica TaxID=461633 RepID=A0AAP0P731_9MAGN